MCQNTLPLTELNSANQTNKSTTTTTTDQNLDRIVSIVYTIISIVCVYEKESISVNCSRNNSVQVSFLCVCMFIPGTRPSQFQVLYDCWFDVRSEQKKMFPIFIFIARRAFGWVNFMSKWIWFPDRRLYGLVWCVTYAKQSTRQYHFWFFNWWRCPKWTE